MLLSEVDNCPQRSVVGFSHLFQRRSALDAERPRQFAPQERDVSRDLRLGWTLRCLGGKNACCHAMLLSPCKKSIEAFNMSPAPGCRKAGTVRRASSLRRPAAGDSRGLQR